MWAVMPLIKVSMKNVLLTGLVSEMLQMIFIKRMQKPSCNKWLSIPFSRYISAYMEGCRAADVLQKCTSKNVLNSQKNAKEQEILSNSRSA